MLEDKQDTTRVQQGKNYETMLRVAVAKVDFSSRSFHEYSNNNKSAWSCTFAVTENLRTA